MKKHISCNIKIDLKQNMNGVNINLIEQTKGAIVGQYRTINLK